MRNVLNMTKKKKDFPSFFINDNVKVTNKEIIANRFNSFFTSIGPKLAAKIDSSNKPPFSFYLKNQIEHVFSFKQASCTDIEKIIKEFKPKKVLVMIIYL